MSDEPTTPPVLTPHQALPFLSKRYPTSPTHGIPSAKDLRMMGSKRRRDAYIPGKLNDETFGTEWVARHAADRRKRRKAAKRAKQLNRRRA